MDTQIDELPAAPTCRARPGEPERQGAWLQAMRATLLRMFADMACRLR
ncbi:hypothetical protein [Massilia sp. METH4]